MARCLKNVQRHGGVRALTDATGAVPSWRAGASAGGERDGARGAWGENGGGA
jgi:hypothetical protein